MEGVKLRQPRLVLIEQQLSCAFVDDTDCRAVDLPAGGQGLQVVERWVGGARITVRP